MWAYLVGTAAWCAAAQCPSLQLQGLGSPTVGCAWNACACMHLCPRDPGHMREGCHAGLPPTSCSVSLETPCEPAAAAPVTMQVATGHVWSGCQLTADLPPPAAGTAQSALRAATALVRSRRCSMLLCGAVRQAHRAAHSPHPPCAAPPPCACSHLPPQASKLAGFGRGAPGGGSSSPTRQLWPGLPGLPGLAVCRRGWQCHQ